jgi:predicted secreted protein
MQDRRSGRIVVVSHCILNVHSLEDNLAIYPGMEEEVIKLLIEKGVGIYQIPCPEMEISGIFRKALPKNSYAHPKIRDAYCNLAKRISSSLQRYVKKGYEISAVLGAEGSPTCGIDLVGKWKKNVKGKKEFPRDIEFIKGRGVFMEEFKPALDKIHAHPDWIGFPGKSLRSNEPDIFDKALQTINDLI